jgi:hypothetical protein
MANIPENPDLEVTFLIIGVAMSGIQYGSGYLVNSVDIAPMYAGIIMAFSNCVASVCGILAPFAIGFIVEDVSKSNFKMLLSIHLISCKIKSYNVIKFNT